MKGFPRFPTAIPAESMHARSVAPLAPVPWTRREWVVRSGTVLGGTVPLLRLPRGGRHDSPVAGPVSTWTALTTEQLTTWEELAQRALDAAMRAGAQYADVRLTRTLQHPFNFVHFAECTELIGIGVRALAEGYWGFAAAPGGDSTAVARIARDAVAQAKIYAKGRPRSVDLGTIPSAIGHWTMPVAIDPFTVPIEEKLATLQFWVDRANELEITIDTLRSELHFLRQERVVATSAGARFTQTVYESGGKIEVWDKRNQRPTIALEGLIASGKGWELALDANIPAQLQEARSRIDARRAWMANGKPSQIGRYTLVCDGATMAALLDRTLGVATQLDRALGYEANASGTSFLNDPLTMLGDLKVGSSLVTVTANRSAPGQLATVKWDDEGVLPDDFTLIKDGVLVDYQTTREQAAWLAPYYQKSGKPIRSHGCAVADTALCTPLQQTPNLALTPAAGTSTIEELVADVPDGILVTEGMVTADFQVRTGVLQGVMHEIRRGKIGRPLMGGAILYSTPELWKNVIVIGGATTQSVLASTTYPYGPMFDRRAGVYPAKGEPPQRASNSVQAPAAVIASQTIVDLMRKA